MVKGSSPNIKKKCYGLNCVPQNSCVETPILNETVFGDKIFKDIIKVKWGHKGGALIR